MNEPARLDFSSPIPFDVKTEFDRKQPALLIGCGAVAINFHFPRIQSLVREAQIYLFEPDPIRRSYLENRWQSNPRVVPVATVPDCSAFSIVAITSPPKFHLDGFRTISKRADHVLIEKPIALSSAEAEDIAKQAQMDETTVFVNLIRRLLLNFKLARAHYKDATFGRLTRVKLSEGGVFNWPAVSMGSFDREINGGGVLMDTGPHALDLLAQVFDELTLVKSKMDSWGTNTSIEANCELECVGDGQVPVEVNLSRNRFLANNATFEFEDATLVLHVRDNTIECKTKCGLEYTMLPAYGEHHPLPYPAFFDKFYEQYIVPGNNREVSPELSARTLRLIEDAYEKATTLEGGF